MEGVQEMPGSQAASIRPITNAQKRAIHCAIRAIGMSDEDYRMLLMDGYGVETCKALTFRQASELLDHLNTFSGRRKKTHARLPHKGRPMATPAQLRMIEAMWAEVAYKKDRKWRERSLNRFLKRIVGIEHINWLQEWQVKKVVRAINAIKEQKAKKEK